MLSVDLVEEFLHRAGIDDLNLQAVDYKQNEVITLFDPDGDFESVREGISKYPPYLREIVDNGVDFLEVEVHDYYDGYKTKLSYLISKGQNGFGVVIKVVVKLIECNFGGTVKYFTSIEDMKKYLELNS